MEHVTQREMMAAINQAADENLVVRHEGGPGETRFYRDAEGVANMVHITGGISRSPSTGAVSGSGGGAVGGRAHSGTQACGGAGGGGGASSYR